MNNSYLKITDLEKQNIVNDYNKGLTINELIVKYHHKYYTIVRILDENDTNHGRLNNFHIKFPKVKLTEEEKQIVIKTYTEEKKGLAACARAIGHNDINLIKKVLKEANVNIRNFSEAATVSNINRKKFLLNDMYFQTESHNMAYILGFIAADGTVRKDNNEIKITLNANDAELLEKISEELELSRPIKFFTNSKGYECCTLWFTSSQIKKDLAVYNIVPSKTFTFKFPENLKKEYWIDFIRGYFDGDGSVSTSGAHAIKWQVCAATSDVLEHIVDYFYTEYQIPKVKVREEKRPVHNLFTICYSTNATKKIYEILYTENSMFLPRKKEKFTQLVQNNK